MTAKPLPKVYTWRHHKLKWNRDLGAYCKTVRGIKLVVFPPHSGHSTGYRALVSAPMFSATQREPSGKTALDKCVRRINTAMNDCSREIMNQVARREKLGEYQDRLGVWLGNPTWI